MSRKGIEYRAPETFETMWFGNELPESARDFNDNWSYEPNDELPLDDDSRCDDCKNDKNVHMAPLLAIAAALIGAVFGIGITLIAMGF